MDIDYANIWDLINCGKSPHDIASISGCSYSTIYRISKLKGNWAKANTVSNKKLENAKKLILEAENTYRISANRQQFIKKAINICLSYLIDSLHRARIPTTSQEFIKLITSMRCFEEETEITDEIFENVQQVGMFDDTDEDDDEAYHVGASQFIRDVPMKLRYIPSRSSLNSSFTSMSEVAHNRLDGNEIVSHEFIKEEISEPLRKVEDVESFENLLSGGFLRQEECTEKDGAQCGFQSTDDRKSQFEVVLMDNESVLAFPVYNYHKDAAANLSRSTSAGDTAAMSENKSREAEKSLSMQLNWSTVCSSVKIGINNVKESDEDGKERKDQNVCNENQRMFEDLDTLKHDIKRDCIIAVNRRDNVDSENEVINNSDINSSPRKHKGRNCTDKDDKEQSTRKGKISPFLDKIRVQRSGSSESDLEQSVCEKSRKVIDLKQINEHSEKKNEKDKAGEFSLKKKKNDANTLGSCDEREGFSSDNVNKGTKTNLFKVNTNSEGKSENIPYSSLLQRHNGGANFRLGKKKGVFSDILETSADENELERSSTDNVKKRIQTNLKKMNTISRKEAQNVLLGYGPLLEMHNEGANDRLRRKKDVFSDILETSDDENELKRSNTDNVKKGIQANLKKMNTNSRKEAENVSRVSLLEKYNKGAKIRLGKKKDVFSDILETSDDENELERSSTDNVKKGIQTNFKNMNTISRKEVKNGSIGYGPLLEIHNEGAKIRLGKKKDVFSDILEASDDENELKRSSTGNVIKGIQVNLKKTNTNYREKNEKVSRFSLLEKYNESAKVRLGKKKDVFSDILDTSDDENELEHSNLKKVNTNSRKETGKVSRGSLHENPTEGIKGREDKNVLLDIFESPDDKKLACSISEKIKEGFETKAKKKYRTKCGSKYEKCGEQVELVGQNKKKDAFSFIFESTSESELEQSFYEKIKNRTETGLKISKKIPKTEHHKPSLDSKCLTYNDRLGVIRRKKKRDTFSCILESGDENKLLLSNRKKNKGREVNRIDARFEKEIDRSFRCSLIKQSDKKTATKEKSCELFDDIRSSTEDGRQSTSIGLRSICMKRKIDEGRKSRKSKSSFSEFLKETAQEKVSETEDGILPERKHSLNKAKRRKTNREELDEKSKDFRPSQKTKRTLAKVSCNLTKEESNDEKRESNDDELLKEINIKKKNYGRSNSMNGHSIYKDKKKGGNFYDHLIRGDRSDDTDSENEITHSEQWTSRDVRFNSGNKKCNILDQCYENIAQLRAAFQGFPTDVSFSNRKKKMNLKKTITADDKSDNIHKSKLNQYRRIAACRRNKLKKSRHNKNKLEEIPYFESSDSFISSVDLSSQIIYAINSQEFRNDECIEESGNVLENKKDDRLANNVFLELPSNLQNSSKRGQRMIYCVENKLGEECGGYSGKLKRKNVKIAKRKNNLIARKRISTKMRPFMVSHVGSTWVVDTICGESPTIQQLGPNTLHSSPAKVDVGLSPVKFQDSENLEYPSLVYVRSSSAQSYVRPTPDSSLCVEQFATSTQRVDDNAVGPLFTSDNLEKSLLPHFSLHAIEYSGDEVSKDKKLEIPVAVENNETYLVCSKQTPTADLNENGIIKGLGDQNNLTCFKLYANDKDCVPDSKASNDHPLNYFENQSEDNESDVELLDQRTILSSFQHNSVNVATSVFCEDGRLNSRTPRCTNSDTDTQLVIPTVQNTDSWVISAGSPGDVSFSPRPRNNYDSPIPNQKSQVISREISPQIPLQLNEGIRIVSVRVDYEEREMDSETPDLPMENRFSCTEIIVGEKDNDGHETPDNAQKNKEFLEIEKYTPNEGNYSINQDQSGQSIYCRFSCSEAVHGENDKNEDEISNNLPTNNEFLSIEKYPPRERDHSINQERSGQSSNDIAYPQDYNPTGERNCRKNFGADSFSSAEAFIDAKKSVRNHKSLLEAKKPKICPQTGENQFEMEEGCGQDEACSNAYEKCIPTEMEEHCANGNQPNVSQGIKHVFEPEILLEDHDTDLGTSYGSELITAKHISNEMVVVPCKETVPDLMLAIDDSSGNSESACITMNKIPSCNESSQSQLSMDIKKVHKNGSVKESNKRRETNIEEESSITFIDLCKERNVASELEEDKIGFISRTPSKVYDVSMSETNSRNNRSFRQTIDAACVGSIASAGHPVEILEDLNNERKKKLNPSRITSSDHIVSISKNTAKYVGSLGQKDNSSTDTCIIYARSSVEVLEDSGARGTDQEITSSNKVSACKSVKEVNVEGHETVGYSNIKGKAVAIDKSKCVDSYEGPLELIKHCTNLYQKEGRELHDKVLPHIKKKKRAKIPAMDNDTSNDLKQIGPDLLHQEDFDDPAMLLPKHDYSDANGCEIDTNDVDYDCCSSQLFKKILDQYQCQDRTFNHKSLSDSLSLRKNKNQIKKDKKRQTLLSSDELNLNCSNILKKEKSVKTPSGQEQLTNVGKIGEMGNKNLKKTTDSVNYSNATNADFSLLSDNSKSSVEDVSNFVYNSSRASTILPRSKKKTNELSGILSDGSERKKNQDCSSKKIKGDLSKSEKSTREHIKSTIQDDKRKEKKNRKDKKNRNCHTSNSFESKNSLAMAEESIVKKMDWEISELGSFDSHPNRNLQLANKSDKTSSKCEFVVSENFYGYQGSRAKLCSLENQWTTVKSNKTKTSASQLTSNDQSARRYGFDVSLEELCNRDKDSFAMYDMIEAANVNKTSKTNALAESINTLHTVIQCEATVKPVLSDRVSNKNLKKQKARSCDTSLTNASPNASQTFYREEKNNTKNLKQQKAEVKSPIASIMDASQARSQSISHEETTSNENFRRAKARSCGNSLMSFSSNGSQPLSHNGSILSGTEKSCVDTKMLLKYKKLKVRANARQAKRLNCTMPTATEVPSRVKDDRIKTFMKRTKKNSKPSKIKASSEDAIQNNATNSPFDKSRRLSSNANSERNSCFIGRERNNGKGTLAFLSSQSVSMEPPKKKLFSPWLDKLKSPESSSDPIASTPYQKSSSSLLKTQLADLSDIPLTTEKRSELYNGTTDLSLINDT